jgi:hypothetical protein
VLADLGAAGAIAGIPALHATGHLTFGLLLALAFTAGAFEAPGRTARRAMLPELAAGAWLTLERVISVSTTTEHLRWSLLIGGRLLGACAFGVFCRVLRWSVVKRPDRGTRAGAFAAEATGL